MAGLVQVGWQRGDSRDALLTGEWLVTNGLGGYASGSIAGACTRRYHSQLVAALPAPLGRVVMLNHLDESLRDRTGREWPLAEIVEEFRLELGIPCWIFSAAGLRLEKRLVMPHLQNTTVIAYRLLEGPDDLVLRVRPSLQIRPHEGAVSEPLPDEWTVAVGERTLEIVSGESYPPLRLRLAGPEARMIRDERIDRNVTYRIERERGYDFQGSLWSPGVIEFALTPTLPATLIASVEPWPSIDALDADEVLATETARHARLIEHADPRLQDDFARQLILAASQFLVVPTTRADDAAANGVNADERRTVIAGYHWFTDWGRDTMISLEGMTLVTGRAREARSILRTFAHYIRDGLIPNLFPEGENAGLYHTADATLWFFHAVDRYLEATGDEETRHLLVPMLAEIIERHLAGTHFGIGVDPVDGLLRQGAEGYQLTWMDAKVDGWVVTPRRGKAVEINALFYNALRVLAKYQRLEHDDGAGRIEALAENARRSFNDKFWYADGQYLYDVIEGPAGDETKLRPNQLFAVSLPHPVLEERRWARVVEVCRETLLTPVGLRSLAPSDPDYQPCYDGDLRARDAAYHEGTVWGWLIGPFVDAWLKVHPDDHAGARRFLDGFRPHLSAACVGQISEVFDATDPYLPRGCIAQAWSVAEVLRCLVKTEIEN